MKLVNFSLSKTVAFVLVGVLTLAGSLPVTSQFLQRLNNVVYDIILPLQSSGFSDEIVIVAIDDNNTT